MGDVLNFTCACTENYGIIKTTTPEKPVISGLPGLSVTNVLLFSVL